MSLSVQQNNTKALWDGSRPFSLAMPREKIILQYFGLVKYIIRQMHISNGFILSKNDLLHFGILGLNEAIEHFDPSKCIKFETYALPRIKGTILDEIRKIDWVPRSIRQKMREIEKSNITEMNTGDDLLRSEIARKLSIPIVQYERLFDEAQKTYNGDSTFSIQEPNHLIDLDEVIDDDAESPYEIITQNEMRNSLVENIEQLPQKYQLVVALYYYEELSLTEIAQLLQLSVPRISQIHRDALKMLREKLMLVS